MIGSLPAGRTGGWGYLPPQIPQSPCFERFESQECPTVSLALAGSIVPASQGPHVSVAHWAPMVRVFLRFCVNVAGGFLDLPGPANHVRTSVKGREVGVSGCVSECGECV
jgi:hypothetical protein